MSIENHRWAITPNDFATTLRVDDAPGFFAKGLIIEPGTRAMIIDEGYRVGEVGPGSYTLETFEERLQFWKKKQCTVVLTREEDFPLEICAENVPTAENLLVTADTRLTVQIDDVGLFSRNLMGATATFSASDLRESIVPLIQQALWESVGSFSITDLAGPQARAGIDAGLQRVLSTSLARYGLAFTQAQAVSIHHERYDEHRQKVGEAWLVKEGIAHQEQLNELYSDEELNRIKRFERKLELQALEENVAADGMESQLQTKLRRIGIRNELRDAVLSEKFDKISTAEELKDFLHERDKSTLIRQEEMDELQEGYRQRKDDREGARQHLAAKLELERNFELDGVRSELNHAVKMKSIERETELARRTASQENEAWLRDLERDRQEREHRRQERDKEREQDQEWARTEGSHRRNEEMQEMIHERDMARIRRDMSWEDSQHQKRAGMLELELRTARDAQDQKETEWKQALQLDKLRTVTEINADEAQRQADIRLREQQQAGEQQIRMAEIQAGTAEEMAKLREEKARMEAADDALREQSEKDKATMDQIAALMQKSQENLVDLAKSQQPQPPVVVVPPSGTPVTPVAPPQPGGIVVCRHCSTQNAVGSTHCGRCQQPLG